MIGVEPAEMALVHELATPVLQKHMVLVDEKLPVDKTGVFSTARAAENGYARPKYLI